MRIAVPVEHMRRRHRIASIWAVCMPAVVLVSACAVLGVASAGGPGPEHSARYVYMVRVGVWSATVLLAALLPIGRYLWFRRYAGAGQLNLVRGLMTAAVTTYTLCAIPPVLGFVFFLDNAFPFGHGMAVTGLALLQMFLYLPQYSLWEERLLAVEG